MADSLSQRATERKIYEEIVNVIVDMAKEEFPEDGEARYRIYTLVAENFAGMVKSFKRPQTGEPSLMDNLKYDKGEFYNGER